MKYRIVKETNGFGDVQYVIESRMWYILKWRRVNSERYSDSKQADQELTRIIKRNTPIKRQIIAKV